MAEQARFIVGEENEGRRLDVFLAEALKKKYSRTFIKKMIDGGNILCNKNKAKARHIVASGDEVELEIPEPEQPDIRPQNLPLDILYEDDDLIVINKKPGLVVHPGAGNREGTLVNALVYHCGGLSGIGGVLRPGIVHRLDKDTSGIIVAAKTDPAHRALSEQFKSRGVKKTYIALVKGIVQLDNGIIEAPIGRHPRDRKRMGVTYLESRDAVTRYKVLKRFKDFSMLEISLGTGRTHQIRVHMAHIGHPLVGDKTYGTPKGIERQALHAKALSFIHPATGKVMEFTTNIPEDMQAVVNRGYL